MTSKSLVVIKSWEDTRFTAENTFPRAQSVNIIESNQKAYSGRMPDCSLERADGVVTCRAILNLNHMNHLSDHIHKSSQET